MSQRHVTPLRYTTESRGLIIRHSILSLLTPLRSRLTGAIGYKITYGYTVEADGNDPPMQVANEVVSG